jgi:transcriptional regulator with XRE-family HTH domain
MTFGARLKQARERAGLSQAELARRSGLSVRNVQNWEQGHREPLAGRLLALARALGVPVESLLVDSVAGRGSTKEAPPRKPRGRKAKGK